jgi:hypothetical protein
MISINMLPDDDPLAIFDFFADEDQITKKKKRDRGVAVTGTRVSAMAVCCFWLITSLETATCLYGQNTCEGHAGCLACLFSSGALVIAVLEHGDRSMRRIDLASVPELAFGKVLAAMQEPFPGLEHLNLWSTEETAPLLPDSFLC